MAMVARTPTPPTAASAARPGDAAAPARRLLIVEDEAPIRAGLVALFESQGFAVDAVGDGLAAVERAAGGDYAAILLDIMLPGLDGLSVLSHLRSRDDTVPVVLLTAKGAEEDIVEGLERGADDYVTKPFGVHELLARVRGLLRRLARERGPRDGNGASAPPTVGGAPPGDAALPAAEASRVITVQVDGVVGRIDNDNLIVQLGNSSVRLTAKEAALLTHLAHKRHRAVGRDELLVEVWGYRDGSIQTRTVDMHVLQLRHKLQTIGADAWVVTVRGRGYRFDPGGG
jgi:DNA-binding response OmpR family regulator